MNQKLLIVPNNSSKQYAFSTTPTHIRMLSTVSPMPSPIRRPLFRPPEQRVARIRPWPGMKYRLFDFFTPNPAIRLRRRVERALRRAVRHGRMPELPQSRRVGREHFFEPSRAGRKAVDLLTALARRFYRVFVGFAGVVMNCFSIHFTAVRRIAFQLNQLNRIRVQSRCRAWHLDRRLVHH